MPDPLLMIKVSLPKLRHIFVPKQKVLRQLSEGGQDWYLRPDRPGIGGDDLGRPALELIATKRKRITKQTENRNAHN